MSEDSNSPVSLGWREREIIGNMSETSVEWAFGGKGRQGLTLGEIQKTVSLLTAFGLESRESRQVEKGVNANLWKCLGEKVARQLKAGLKKAESSKDLPFLDVCLILDEIDPRSETMSTVDAKGNRGKLKLRQSVGLDPEKKVYLLEKKIQAAKNPNKILISGREVHKQHLANILAGQAMVKPQLTFEKGRWRVLLPFFDPQNGEACLLNLGLEEVAGFKKSLKINRREAKEFRQAKAEKAKREILVRMVDQSGQITGQEVLANEVLAGALEKMNEIREKQKQKKIQVLVTDEISDQSPVADGGGRMAVAGQEVRAENWQRVLKNEALLKPILKVVKDKEGHERPVYFVPVVTEAGEVLIVRLTPEAYRQAAEKKGTKKEAIQPSRFGVKIIGRGGRAREGHRFLKRSFADEFTEYRQKRLQENFKTGSDLSFPLVFMAEKPVKKMPRTRRGEINFKGRRFLESDLVAVLEGKGRFKVFKTTRTVGPKGGAKVYHCLPLVDQEGHVLVLEMAQEDLLRFKKKYGIS